MLKAVTLTRDHLALHAVERSRIERSGGFVSADGRLNGKMQVSRSFGDAALKKVGTEQNGSSASSLLPRSTRSVAMAHCL